MEKILKIEEYELPNYKDRSWETLEGYKITTDKQEITIGIENDRRCCETWGYFMSEDNLTKFVDSDLIDIRLTDKLNMSVDLKKNVKEYLIDENTGELDLFCGEAMFVDFITSVGVLQFVAYNEHNGYYGHEACVISTQLKHEVIL